MFGINMYGVKPVESYEEAATMLDRASKRKGRGEISGNTCYAIPGKEGSRVMSIRWTGDGVAFRYHHTDVITWHPDNSYTLDSYSSRSTCGFFNRFCPAGTRLTREGEVLIIGDTGYALAFGAVHVKDGKLNGSLGRFERERVNRKNAKAVLAKTRYAEYRDWYKTMKPLLGDVRQPYFDAVECLADDSTWPMMASCMVNDGHPDRVRLDIYRANADECFETVVYDNLPADKAERSAYKVRN